MTGLSGRRALYYCATMPVKQKITRLAFREDEQGFPNSGDLLGLPAYECPRVDMEIA